MTRFDGQTFDVDGDSLEFFVATLKHAFLMLKYSSKDTHDKTATHYAIKKNNKLAFYWGEPTDLKGAIALPFKHNEEAMVNFASAWLTQADHGPEEDTDGSIKKGWRVYYSTSPYTKSEEGIGSFYCIVAIEAIWTVYGK